MSPYALLAKSAVEIFVKENRIIKPDSNAPTEFLNKKSGVFVTIKKGKSLKGCIGTYLPTRQNIAEEIIHNAIAAAAEDYRFEPIKKEELPGLSYIIYILSKPEAVADIKKLDPKKYGIIVTASPKDNSDNKNENGRQKTGLLLPDLEGVDTVEQQIYIACQKGEINPEREKISIFKFTAEKYK